ncbi:MAG: hypothetical protein WCK78_07265 [Paludibacter sp.]
MKKLSRLIVYVALAVTPMLFSHCTLTEDLSKLKTSLDSVKLVIGTPEFKALVHIDFVDAKTKHYITDVATVKIGGTNATAVYSTLGESVTTCPTMMGMLDLIVDPHLAATLETNPVEFTVTTKLDGYVNVTQKVTFIENKIQAITIPLIKISDAPSGVKVSSNNNFAATSATGTVNQTATENMNLGAQTVEIPQGVVLKDASGNPVTGTVKSQVIFYNPTDSAAQASIPGGLDVSAKQADGSTGSIKMVSAGMFGVNLSTDNQEVKSFGNGGIKIKTKVDPAMINPNTGAPIKENDVIEMWSKDEGSGEWKFEKMDTVRKVGSDLILEESVSHLSTWNWDFFTNSCPYGAKIVFKGDNTPVTGNVTTNVYQWSFEKTDIFTAKPGDPYYGFIQLQNTPYNKAAKLTFVSTTPGVTFTPAVLDVPNLCSGSYEVTINHPSVPVANTLTVKTDLGLSSTSQQNLIIKPNAAIYLRESISTSAWVLNSMTNGVANLNIKLGVLYDIYAFYGNSSATAKLRVDKINNTLVVTCTPTVNAGSTSNTVTLPPVAIPANNTIIVKYNIVLSDNVFNSLKSISK